MSVFDFDWGNTPTEIGVSYAYYRMLGYSDTEAAVLAQEAYLNRPLTDFERKAFIAAIENEGGTILLTAKDTGEDIGTFVDTAGKGFFGSLGPSGWVALLGTGAIVAGGAYLVIRRPGLI